MVGYETEHLDDFVDTSKDDLLNEVKNVDRGYAKIWGYVERADGSFKKSKIDIYTSGFSGNHIRNAETGEYCKEIVGSLDEDLYFKMIMATGQLKAKNNSNTLFYNSPDHCMRHLQIDINPELVAKWEEKRNNRLAVRRSMKEKRGNVVVK